MLRACWLLLLLTLVPLSATAATAGRVDVRLIPEAGQLRAVFILPRPTTKFVLAEPSPEIRADTWRMATPGLTLADDQITSADGKPFRRVEIVIKPDSIERDRTYPALTVMGPQGWMIYGPYLSAAEGETRITARLPKGWVSLSSAGDSLDLKGYGYLGSGSYVKRGAATLVAAPGTPNWIRDRVLASAEGATAFYTRRLGLGLRRPPLILLRLSDDQSAGFRGDTTPGEVVSLRFHGKSWLAPDDQAGRRIARFVAHEFFHFWNTGLTRPADGSGAWLHEGAAEYAALRYGLQAGELTEAEFREELSDRLTGCMRVLPTTALTVKGPTKGPGVYHCGVVAEWLADLQAGRGGTRNMFSLWGPIFARGQATYSVADFQTAAGAGPLDLLLTGSGPDRWSDLTRALLPFGVTLSGEPDPPTARGMAVMHLLDGLCPTKPRGFYGAPDHLILDASGGCEAAVGGADIDALDGHNLFSDPLGAFDAVRAACDAQRTVKVGFQGRPVAEWLCTAPLGPRPSRSKVVTSGLPAS